ncbi:MAG TPA: hypothetical protein PKA52_08555, partial [bacterium]|nr:hypothetical protein [bacterium]
MRRSQKQFYFIALLTLYGYQVPLLSQVAILGYTTKFNFDGGFEYNTWSPHKTNELKYDIEGFRIGYVRGELVHDIPFIPDMKFNWETNFGAKHQEEILKAHNSMSKLEQGYEKMNAILSFFPESKIKKEGDEKVEMKNRDGSVRKYHNFEISYTKETFYIGVTPATEGLNYAAYASGKTYGFPYGTSISQFTKFEEISATFYTDGKLYIFWIINAFFSAAADRESAFSDESRIFQFPEADSRIGVFYSTFQKPYSVNQVLTQGEVINSPNTIYNARFQAAGIIDEISSPAQSSLIARWTNRFGYSWINLRKKEDLEDTNSPGFFYFGTEAELGFRIHFNKFSLNLSASGNFGFMQGLNVDTEAEQF